MRQKYIAAEKTATYLCNALSIYSHNLNSKTVRTLTVTKQKLFTGTPLCGPIREYLGSGPFEPSVGRFDLLGVHFLLSAARYKVAFDQF